MKTTILLVILASLASIAHGKTVEINPSDFSHGDNLDDAYPDIWIRTIGGDSPTWGSYAVDGGPPHGISFGYLDSRSGVLEFEIDQWAVIDIRLTEIFRSIDIFAIGVEAGNKPELSASRNYLHRRGWVYDEVPVGQSQVIHQDFGVDIDGIRLTSRATESGFSVQKIVFNTEEANIPEPASIAMFIAGTTLLVYTKRRQKA